MIFFKIGQNFSRIIKTALLEKLWKQNKNTIIQRSYVFFTKIIFLYLFVKCAQMLPLYAAINVKHIPKHNPSKKLGRKKLVVFRANNS